MTFMIKVRFHLGRGKNYKKWQVSCQKRKVYYDPNEVNLKLHDCKLHNNSKIATSIFKGANKTVCSWISCNAIEILPPKIIQGKQIFYNPRSHPNWHSENESNLDKQFFKTLQTYGKNVFVHE